MEVRTGNVELALRIFFQFVFRFVAEPERVKERTPNNDQSDDVRQPDGTIKHKLICKKLDVEYGGKYRRKKDVEPFVRELAPVNSGLLNP